MDESLADSLRRVSDLMARPDAPRVGPAPGDGLSPEDLRGLCADPGAPSAARASALRALSERWRGEAAFSDLVLSLLDDPSEPLAAEAIALAPPFDGRVIARLRGMLDDPRPARREASALALARKKDHAILPTMLAWARHGDAPRRRAGLAAVAFLLIPEQHLAVVESICEEGPRDDADEAVLIDALRVAEARVAFWRKALGEADS